ncbi:hypothetical protein ACFL6C_02250 [Myxococcota bacterium]
MGEMKASLRLTTVRELPDLEPGTSVSDETVRECIDAVMITPTNTPGRPVSRQEACWVDKVLTNNRLSDSARQMLIGVLESLPDTLEGPGDEPRRHEDMVTRLKFNKHVNNKPHVILYHTQEFADAAAVAGAFQYSYVDHTRRNWLQMWESGEVVDLSSPPEGILKERRSGFPRSAYVNHGRNGPDRSEIGLEKLGYFSGRWMVRWSRGRASTTGGVTRISPWTRLRGD